VFLLPGLTTRRLLLPTLPDLAANHLGTTDRLGSAYLPKRGGRPSPNDLACLGKRLIAPFSRERGRASPGVQINPKIQDFVDPGVISTSLNSSGRSGRDNLAPDTATS
jgi:hypothetical protein